MNISDLSTKHFNFCWDVPEFDNSSSSIKEHNIELLITRWVNPQCMHYHMLCIIQFLSNARCNMLQYFPFIRYHGIVFQFWVFF